MALEGYKVHKIRPNGLIEWMSERHYSQTCPRNISFAFELVDYKNIRMGLCLFGQLSRRQAQQKYPHSIELTRLWVDDSVPKNGESFLIGAALRHLRRFTNYLSVISYSDPNVGHQGTIYRACNFQQDGFTKPSYHYEKDGRRIHIRSVWERARNKRLSGYLTWTEKDQALEEGLTRIDDSPKIRYIYYLRPRSEKLVGRKVNERIKFFSEWTRESAWVYGLIIGDGNIYIHNSGKTHMVSVVGNDDTIQKINALLPGAITKFLGKNKQVRSWYVHDKELAYWFKSRGICGRKKLSNSLWPNDLPESVKWDFIRGLIDSDGSFGWDSSYGHKCLYLGFSSANKTLIDNIFNELRSSNSSLSIRSSQKNQFITYSFKLDQNQTICVLDKIYNCPKNIRNEERYEKYLKGKQLFETWESRKCITCGKKAHDLSFCWQHMMEKKRNELREIMQCSVDGCAKPYHGNGFCMAHLWSDRKSKDPRHNLEVGRRIAQKRKELGFSQLMLSKMAGYKGNGHLSNVENGRSAVAKDFLVKISEILNTPAQWFLTGNESSENIPKVSSLNNG